MEPCSAHLPHPPHRLPQGEKRLIFSEVGISGQRFKHQVQEMSEGGQSPPGALESTHFVFLISAPSAHYYLL